MAKKKAKKAPARRRGRRPEGEWSPFSEEAMREAREESERREKQRQAKDERVLGALERMVGAYEGQVAAMAKREESIGKLTQQITQAMASLVGRPACAPMPQPPEGFASWGEHNAAVYAAATEEEREQAREAYRRWEAQQHAELEAQRARREEGDLERSVDAAFDGPEGA